jgi:predicted SAM-dependent methyltransferase
LRILRKNIFKSLEIGSGTRPVCPQWDRLDVRPGPGVTVAARWGDGPLPIADNTYDLVYASHVLEHVAWFKTASALREAYRVLKPGGVLEVWVPDFSKIVDSYRAGRCGDHWRKHNPHGDPWRWLNGRIFAYGPEPNWHKAVFDPQSLARRLREAGFVRIRKLRKPRGYDHGPVNLGMRGVKP